MCNFLNCIDGLFCKNGITALKKLMGVHALLEKR